MTPAELARRLLTEAAGQDPFDLFDAGSSDVLWGDQADERLAEHRFEATLDRRHFTVVRHRHVDAFVLLP